MKKPNPKIGRPPLGDKARSSTYLIKLTPAERDAWEREAEDAEMPLAAWIRARCGDGVCTRIVVEPDGDDEWFFTAYDRHGNKLGAGVVDKTDRKSVRRRVEGDHVLVDAHAVAIDVAR